MDTSPPSLDSLRREIDAIDDEMHDLLMRRTEIVEKIADIKNGESTGSAMRPAREVAILRRLVGRHGGLFPAQVVVRIWREVVAALTRLQGPFRVAVHAPEKSVGYWDLARDHYGSGTPMSLHRNANRVISAVVEGDAEIGVLTLPQNGEPQPWWPRLLAPGETMPRIAARLPFIDNEAGRFETLGALAIGRIERRPTGDDVTLVAVEVKSEISRSTVADGLVGVGLAARDIATWEDPASPETRLHLIEIEGFVEDDDTRLMEAVERLGSAIIRLMPLGGYAVPLGNPDVARSG